MANPFRDRKVLSQIALIGLMVVILCSLLVYRFTAQTSEERERARARVVLHGIYELERAHYLENGTYLPIDRENNGEILKLSDVPGLFHYHVEVAGSTFVAVAEADLDGNGEVEIWQIDSQHPDPILKKRD